jgi:mono/diheme cytochrome c family protein
MKLTENIMKNTTVLLALGIAAIALPAVAADPLDLSKLPPASKKTGVTYATDIKPLFEASCVRCHGENRPKANLSLNSLEGVLKGGKDGKVVVPGSSEKSKLVVAVSQLDAHSAMPPKPRQGGGRRGPGGPGNPPPGAPGVAHPPGGPEGGPQGKGPQGPPPKPLTAEEVGLVRAWVDQGAK